MRYIHVCITLPHLDLVVRKQESCFLPLSTSSEQELLQVLPPLNGGVVLGDLDLVETVVCHEGGQLAGTLPSTASHTCTHPRTHTHTHTHTHTQHENVTSLHSHTDEEGVAIVLLEHSTDARNMLNGKFEHHQLHWCLAHLVVLLQVARGERGMATTPNTNAQRSLLNGGCELCEVLNLIIDLGLCSRDHVVSKEEASDIIIHHCPFAL